MPRKNERKVKGGTRTRARKAGGASSRAKADEMASPRGARKGTRRSKRASGRAGTRTRAAGAARRRTSKAPARRKPATRASAGSKAARKTGRSASARARRATSKPRRRAAAPRRRRGAAGPRSAAGSGYSECARRALWIASPGHRAARPGQTLATRNHDVIRQWAEERGAVPATVPGTERDGRPGVLRFDFPDYGGGRLRAVDWDEWFETFDERRLVFLFQGQMKDGRQTNFCRLDSPQRADE